MVSACVLVYCKAGEFLPVTEKVKGIEGVKRAFTVMGRYDVIAEIGAPDLDGIVGIAIKINSLPSVRATETLVEAKL